MSESAWALQKFMSATKGRSPTSSSRDVGATGARSTPSMPALAPGPLLDQLGLGLCVFDDAQRLVLFNRCYGAMYGIPSDALRLGMSLSEIIEQRFVLAGSGEAMSREEHAAQFTRIVDRKQPFSTTVLLRDGRSIAVHQRPLLDGGIASTHEDVTERIRAQAKLFENEGRLREKTQALDTVLDTMDQGLMMIDANGVVQVCNRRAIELLDLPAQMMRSQPAFEAVRHYQLAQDDVGGSPETIRRWIASTGLEHGAYTYERERPNGTVVEISTVPLPAGGAVRTYTDMTRRRTSEAALQESESRYRLLAENTTDVIIWSDLATTRRYVSPAVRTVLGYEPNDLVGTRPLDFVHPDDVAQYRRVLADLTDGHIEQTVTTQRYRHRKGSWVWIEASFKLTRDPDGNATGYVASLRDVTDRKEAEEKLRLSKERLGFALDSGSDGLWDCDLVSGEAWSSDRWWTMLGYVPGELESHAVTWRALLHPEDAPRAQHELTEHMEGRTPAYECEHRLRRKDGTWAWMLTRGRIASRGPDGTPLRFVGTQIDISARKAAERQIAHMASHDGLTDLPNRALFHERLNDRLNDLDGGSASCAVLCLDLDRFKTINDSLGHLAGDAVLRAVAHRLRATLQPEDTIARLGGDEFAVLLAVADEPHRVVALAERLIEAVQAPIWFGDQQVEVGLSIGIAYAPTHGFDGETVLRRSDLALYRAKADGRNAYRIFEPSMDDVAAERRELERDLRRAIHGDELCLHYQPQLATAGGELVGFEALVRWSHPERGLIPPNAFIPLAEESGLILPLGEWVLRTACREASSWSRPLKIAVNLSPRQFQQADLPERILSILAETGLSPTRLELEVTETVIINDMARALGILRRLKAFGISIAMDDFGTGYSSLATLQAFPFDKIKIDRSFVGQLGDSPQAAVIVRAVLGLGRSLGMGVVAEGVETQEQMRFLAAEDCEQVQGYLVGKPEPIELFADTIRAFGAKDPGTTSAASAA